MGLIDIVNKVAGAVVPPSSLPSPGDVTTALLKAFGDTVPREMQDLFKKVSDSGLTPQQLWDQLVKGLQAMVDLFGVQMDSVAPAFDAQQTLQKVAEAINAAESTLRQSSFAIIGGTAELEMKIKLLGDDGPAAKLNLQIAPRPHP